MAGRTVLVTDHHFDDLSLEQRLLDGVATVEELDAGSRARRDRQFARADAVLTSRFEFDAARLDSLENCTVISRCGIGVDAVDVAAATERGIHVANAPTYGIEEVAVHTVALILALARRITVADSLVANGGWRRAPPVFTDEAAPEGTRELPIHRLSTQTVGIVGFGNIGRAVCDRLGPFGARIVVFDPYVDAAAVREYPVEQHGFETVVREADYLTIHSPLTDATRNLLDGPVLDQMKDTAYLINCARGPIVDDDALLRALDGGGIEGAALDVFREEPLPADHPLRDHDRVIVTPHIAYYSEESDETRRRQAVENVRAVLEGGDPPYPVNDVSVP